MSDHLVTRLLYRLHIDTNRDQPDQTIHSEYQPNLTGSFLFQSSVPNCAGGGRAPSPTLVSSYRSCDSHLTAIGSRIARRRPAILLVSALFILYIFCGEDCINFSISKVTSIHNMAETGGMEVGEEHGGVKEEQQEVGVEGDNSSTMPVNRKEKRKSLKNMKRKQLRKEMAEREREEEERRMNDPEVLRRLNETEEMERLRMERDRKEFEERERKLLEEMERQRQLEEDEADRRNVQEEKEEEEEVKRRLQAPKHDGVDEDSNWEYVEEGPPEIIWQGNEIIVRKKKVRVPKKHPDVQMKEDANRPTSNPLPPESEASSLTAQEMLKNVAQEVPNFGTEQDKAHCPFHLKTGTCRFGQRCNRVHFYPDKACTLLIKNMYNGPGLAWEQDEGLEVC
ncbi:Zinc finger CCCH domain-containing protein 5 [Linum grandiflorum]